MPTSSEFPLEIIQTSELDRPEYARNDAQRCFHCKDELFDRHGSTSAAARGFDAIAYGVNLDDQGDFRPGQQAARAAPCRRPAARRRPDQSRHPRPRPGRRPARLGQARLRLPLLPHRVRPPRDARSTQRRRAGEDALRALGFRQFRVRHHGEIVRIEIAKDELPRALDPDMAAEFTRIFKTLGFKFVTLDLEGFRSGSMNPCCPPKTCCARAEARLTATAFRASTPPKSL